MKAASAFRILLTAVALVACRGEQHPAATPMQALQRALDHLAMGDADTYFASLDFGDGGGQRHLPAPQACCREEDAGR